jgi:hypothetical protein
MSLYKSFCCYFAEKTLLTYSEVNWANDVYGRHRLSFCEPSRNLWAKCRDLSTLNRVVYVKAGYKIETDVLFRRVLASCNAPDMNRIARATFLPGYNFPCVFFFPIQPPRNTRRKFHNILFLDFSFSVGLSVCISLSLSLPLHFGRLNTPYAHPPRDHPLPFLYATIHHVIYDGRKPHSRKKKPRNKVG